MWGIVFCFLVPLLTYFRISVVGELTLTEVIVIAVAVVNLRRYFQLWRDRRFRLIVSLACCWLLSAIISDIYRQTPPEDFLRGWARIAVLICSLFSVAGFVWDDKHRIVAFAMGHFCALPLYALVTPVDLPFYKFIIGFLVSGGSFVLSAWISGVSPPLGRVIPVVAGVLALYANARSLAGITLMAAAYPWIYYDYRIRVKLTEARTIVPLAVLAIVGLSVIWTYKFTASSGLLGESAQNKYEEQLEAQNGKFSIFSGRAEVFFSVPKIIESPLIGWGSWARDLQFVEARKIELGIKNVGGDRVIADLIPTHSHFFGAWMEAGILGGLFWGVILVFTAKVLLANGLAFMGGYRGVGVFILFLFMWDIIFSPFGGERRVFNSFIIWVVILALNYAERAVAQKVQQRVPRSTLTSKLK
jgi:hypothetical protein